MTGKMIMKDLRYMKKRVVLSAVCIMLSVVLIFTTENVYVSFQNMQLESAYDRYGEYNLILHDIDPYECRTLINEVRSIASFGVEQQVRTGIQGATVICADENAIAMNHYGLLSGEYPFEKKEIAISPSYKINGSYIIKDYQVGDYVKLGGGTYRISGFLELSDYSTENSLNTILRAGNPGAGDLPCNLYIHVKTKRAYKKVKTILSSHFGINEEEIPKGDKITGFQNDWTIIDNHELNAIQFEGAGSVDEKNVRFMIYGVFLILTLSAFVLTTLVYFSYWERCRRNIGVLKIIGYSDLKITALFGMEVFIVTLLGYVAGFSSGIYITKWIFHRIQKIRRLPLEHFDVIISLRAVLLTLGILLLSFFLVLFIYAGKTGSKESGTLISGARHGRKRFGKEAGRRRYLTVRYYFRDKFWYETVCVFFSVFVAGLSLLFLLFINQYIGHQQKNEEKFDAQYQLICGTEENLPGIRKTFSDAAYYDELFDTQGFFDFSENINPEYKDLLLSDKNGYVSCDICGVSRAYYEKNIDTSVSYDTLLSTKSALVVDQENNTTETVLTALPDEVSYAGRAEDNGPRFSSGEIAIAGRGKPYVSLNQTDITVYVPQEVFEDKFSPTMILIRINAVRGKETAMGKKLNTCAPVLSYILIDNVSDYLKEKDNNRTVRFVAYSVLLLTGLINLLIICYLQFLIQIRRDPYLNLLKVLGHSEPVLFLSYVISGLPDTVFAAVTALCAATVYIRKRIPLSTRGYLLDGGYGRFIRLALVSVLFQMIAYTLVFVMRQPGRKRLRVS